MSQIVLNCIKDNHMLFLIVLISLLNRLNFFVFILKYLIVLVLILNHLDVFLCFLVFVFFTRSEGNENTLLIKALKAVSLSLRCGNEFSSLHSLFFYAIESWYSITDNFSSVFCQLIFTIFCHIHRESTIYVF